MGFPNLVREFTRARLAYVGSVRRLDQAMEAFSRADVPLMPSEDGHIEVWNDDHVAAMGACAEAWSEVLVARRGFDAAQRDLAANDP
jgi:hypothetical protein